MIAVNMATGNDRVGCYLDKEPHQQLHPLTSKMLYNSVCLEIKEHRNKNVGPMLSYMFC